MRQITIAITLFLSISFVASAQQGTEALEKDNKNLQERYLVLKTKSQSFKEYKVIKETVLDGWWSIVRDSVKSNRLSIQKANSTIAGYKAQTDSLHVALRQKEQSMSEIVFASAHITVLGIDFNKKTFVTIVSILFVALLVVIGVFFGRMKLQAKVLSEKSLAVHSLSSEYEDYKQRAMDKQTKLSRELQDERNKLHGMRNS